MLTRIGRSGMCDFESELDEDDGVVSASGSTGTATQLPLGSSTSRPGCPGRRKRRVMLP